MIQKTVLASGGWYHVRSVVVAAAISQPSSAAGPLPRGRETDEMRHENASVRALHILWPHLAAAPTSDLVLCDTSSRRPSAGLSTELRVCLSLVGRRAIERPGIERSCFTFQLSVSRYTGNPLPCFACMNHAVAGGNGFRSASHRTVTDEEWTRCF